MLNLPVALDQFELTGELIQAVVPKPDGSSVTQYACPACLSRIHGTNSARPGVLMLRAGTLDESDQLVPAVHLWTSRKQPWLQIPEQAPAFETQPADPHEWMRYLRPSTGK